MLRKLKKRIDSFIAHPNSQDEGIFSLLWQAMPYYVSRKGFSLFPKIIYLVVNSVCNLHCKMCDVGMNDKETYFYKNMVADARQELDPTRLKALFEEVKKFKPLISITSTEPLLYGPLLEVCEYATKKCGLKVSINTNGLLLEDMAEGLLRAGITRIVVSLDGPPEVNDMIRGFSGGFNRVLAGMRKIDRIKKQRKLRYPRFATIHVVTNYNYDSLDRIPDYFSGIDIEKFIFSHMTFITQEMADAHNRIYAHIYPITHSCIGGGIDPKKVDVEVLWDQLDKVKRMLKNKAFFSPTMDKEDLQKYYLEPDSFVGGHRCYIPWGVSQITASGDVIGLTRCFHYPMGNIYENSFKEIWNGDKLRRFRKDLRAKGAFVACSRCRGVL